VNALWIALGFLSRSPTKHAEFNDRDAARAVAWFPAVGLFIGAIVVLVAQVTAMVWGNGVAAFLALGAWVGVTGALHLDGLADTFDGFSASNSGKARALDAMKDSRIGAHGACALGLTLLGKWVLLQRCIEVGAVVPGILGATVIARQSAGFLLSMARPAAATGLGALFARELRTKRGRWMPWWGAVWFLAAAPCIWLLPQTSWSACVVALGASVVVSCAVLLWFVRRCCACFGGVTGDTHGAAIEFVELLVLAVNAAVFGKMSA
jgi:adenosylcobinamide-GDP ribazoletransferase